MTMTTEEIMSFQGHEFIYFFEDGDTMPAYIKKIDLDKKIMTCWSFSLVTDNGTSFLPSNEDEENEEACCLCFENDLDKIIEIITEIKNTRKHTYRETGTGIFYGCPF